jgi:hypothetical protein
MDENNNLEFTINVNMYDDKIITIYAKSKTHVFNTEKTLMFFAQMRIEGTIKKMIRRYNKIEKYLKVRK